ncbi:MAG: V-type ATP synthase subunit B, partial [Synergistaceae bacterium]|nr:V-type ATP synthase subunit B [Synergistaceae bacterium]
MAQAEYIGVLEVNGPFILVEGSVDAFYGELVDVRSPDGRIRRGRVTALSEKTTLVQVFSGTDDLVPNSTRVR